MRDGPFRVAPDFRPRALVVRERIVGVGELIEDAPLALALHLLGEVSRGLHPAALGVRTIAAPKARMVWRRSADRCSGMTSTMR